ncbi:cytochrome ubiquinol oxidase subunit I [candidate division KSB1 bacterium]|nr:cytochrome ubiquinol oxidase subunit I [candidate division KSB1 bacterium]
MDAVFLSRLQFALAAGFHFLFPPLTLGLTLLIFIIESLHVKRGEEIYKHVADFLIKLLGLVFILGTATGITLEFAFGTNWSNYSRMVGDIFGAPLAAEGVFAFFMESIFLGVLLFGRNKVSKKMYRISAFLVFFGAHLSGLWIIIANSFMQTPAGYELVTETAGEFVRQKAVLTNFWQAALNHSTIERFTHTIVAGWLTGSLFGAGIGAWYISKGKFVEPAKKLLKVALVVFIIAGVLQIVTGHQHGIQVANTQPTKLAAFEGLWETQKGASLSLFGIPDAKNEITHCEIGIPGLLSLFAYLDADAEVKGLKEFPKDKRPPVFLTFASYHVMIALGTLFLLMAIVGAYLLARDKLWKTNWFLKLLILAIPLPHIANQTGWIAAEVGRQPWAVYGILKTADAASVVVPAGQVLFTLIMFTLIYALLFAIFLMLMLKMIRKGPVERTEYGY